MTEIADYGFQNAAGLTTVVWNEGLQKIGKSIFNNVPKLKLLGLKDSLEEGIVTFPSTLNEAAGENFKDLPQFTKMVFAGTPAGSTAAQGSMVPAKIGYNAKYITEVEFAGSVTEVGDSAFEGAVALKSVTWNNWLAKVGKNVFKGCAALEQVEVRDTSDGNDEASGASGDGSADGSTGGAEGTPGADGKKGIVEIPGTLKTIAAGTFNDCVKLE